MQYSTWVNNHPNLYCLVVLPALITGAMMAYAGSVMAVLKKVLPVEIPVTVTSFKIYMLVIVPLLKAVSSFDEWVDAQF